MTERTGHPDELLAGYVDGDLAGDEREAVETHLAGCATCREEVALARRAVAALEALEPAPSPLGLGTPAILGARTTPRRGVLRPRWAAALAAAAVVVVAAAVGGRFLIQGAGGGAGGGAQRAAPRAPAGVPSPEAGDARLQIPPVVQSDQDYSGDDLQALARRLAGRDALEVPSTTSGTFGPATSDSLTAEAVACLSRAGLSAGAGDVALYVEAARYRGDPAFIVAFRRGNDGGVMIWAVGRADCRVRYTAIQRP